MDEFEVKFKKKIDKLFKDSFEEITKSKFDTFYKTLQKDMQDLNSINGEVKFGKLVYSINKTKDRWVTKYIENPLSGLNVEVQAATYLYEKVISKEIDIDKFRSIYGCDSVDELKARMIKEVEEWKTNKDSLLTSFVGFKKLAKVSIKPAFKNDILKTYYNYINSPESGLKSYEHVTRIPSILGNIGIDTTNTQKFLDKSEINQMESQSSELALTGTIDRLIVSEENQTKILMQLEKQVYLRIANDQESQDLMTQIALIKAVKQLNHLDLKIITHYYTNFYNIVSNDSIGKYISELVNEIGLSDNSNNYKLVVDSLLKIGSIRLEAEYEGRNIKGSLLEVFIDIKNGRKFAEVQLGGFLKTLIIMDSTFNFNKDTFDLLSRDAQQLAIWLQHRRLKNVLDDSKFSEAIAVQYLANAILMRAKDVYKRRDRLSRALEELKVYKLIVKDYEYNSKEYQFIIDYIRLPKEVISNIQNKNFKTGELIEGTISKK